MNSYKLISKMRKVRDDTFLTISAQALYHELVAICNDMRWDNVFFVRSSVICSNLDISDNTLRKARECLSNAGLLHYRTSKDRRIGCYYSFVDNISDELISSVNFEDDKGAHNKEKQKESPSLSSSKSEHDIKMKVNEKCGESSSISSAVSSSKFADEKNVSSATSSAAFEHDKQIIPYIDIKTINKESLVRMRESTPQKKNKSRKGKGDETELIYPFESDAFLSTWEKLRNTPKWKKKLNYALQLSLNKLKEFEEEFAIEQMERAIESNWTGVVFTGTKKYYQEWITQKYGSNKENRGADSEKHQKSAGIKSITFGG